MSPDNRWQGWGDDAAQPPPGFFPDASPPGPGEVPQPVSEEQRRLALDWAVNQRVASGWRVESRSETQAIMVRGARINHTLHLILTLVTCLLWGIVWAILSATNRVERVALTVDAHGGVLTVNAPGE
ncbi:hypothetical protein ACIBAC_11850 [Streptomyces sp. NPDC051362]|uniref:hypothetical protein n=1 Tax=Streptomyces sp. NPDC051362 TaxID=3365651 RepID=UPI0037AD7BE5